MVCVQQAFLHQYFQKVVRLLLGILYLQSYNQARNERKNQFLLQQQFTQKKDSAGYDFITN